MTNRIFVIVSCILALFANACAIVLRLDYITSVLLAMCVVSASVIALGGKGRWSRASILTALVFVFGAAVITTVIEKLMIVFDVWGFSHRTYNLSGILFWGCPIEEYVYWWLAPVVVAATYVAFPRGRGSLDIVMPFKIVSKCAAWGIPVRDAVQASAKADVVDYLDEAAVSLEESSYTRGAKVPVWAIVASLIVAGCFFLYRHFRGSWQAVLATTAVFVCVAYPNEVYSLHCGFWSYNTSRILDIWVLRVPVEEWVMYTASPICGAMLFSILEEMIFGSRE